MPRQCRARANFTPPLLRGAQLIRCSAMHCPTAAIQYLTQRRRRYTKQNSSAARQYCAFPLLHNTLPQLRNTVLFHCRSLLSLSAALPSAAMPLLNFAKPSLTTAQPCHAIPLLCYTLHILSAAPPRRSAPGRSCATGPARKSDHSPATPAPGPCPHPPNKSR